MDYSKPLADEQLEKLKGVFRSLPTYKEGGWIMASDIPQLIKGMNYKRTPEQIQAYVDYWNKNFGGIITIDTFVNSAKSLHSTAEYAKDYAKKFDFDGNNQISKDEFEKLMEIMVKHDPRLEGKSFEEFLAGADTNNDGIVDIDECAAWIEKMLA